MKYLLDSVTAIHWLNGPTDGLVAERIRATGRWQCALSSIVVFELGFGAWNSAPTRRSDNLSKLDQIQLEVLEFSTADAMAAGELRWKLKSIGKPIGSYDLLIAGQALARGLTVVTANRAEFGRVPGLATVDWTA